MTNWECYRLGSADERDYAVDGVPAAEGVTIAAGYFMLKASLDDADADALVSLALTGAPDDPGEIADSGAGDGSGLLKFVISETALAGLDPKRTYFRSLKVRLSNGRYSAPRDADAPVRILAAGVAKASGSAPVASASSNFVLQGFGSGSVVLQGFTAAA